MARKVVAIRILIASPADVASEREIVSEVIERWNAVHSRSIGIIFEAIRWETHSYPASGDRPQAIINSQIVDDADIVVGIFWSRLGTPTGVSPSGTAEEIERLRQSGKHVLLYFSNAPIPQNHDADQFSRLQAYKHSIRENSLVWDFSNSEELHKLFTQHLASLANKIAQEQTIGGHETTKHSANLVTLRAFPRRINRDDSDTWKDGDSIPAAIATFRNDPIKGMTVSRVDGLKAQITFYEHNGGEANRVNKGCWLGNPFNHTSLGVGSSEELIIAIVPDPALPVAVENTRSNAAHYEYEGTTLKQLSPQVYDVNVRLIGTIKDEGDIVEDFHFTLDLRREPKLSFGWTAKPIDSFE
ncbi:MAG TPA: hypothetical protein VFR24_28325 [Candidatus Angelobacter sp.]|nr:hypothetical protein [Candidatus Angelobacter sp.]